MVHHRRISLARRHSERQQRWREEYLRSFWIFGGAEIEERFLVAAAPRNDGVLAGDRNNKVAGVGTGTSIALVLHVAIAEFLELHRGRLWEFDAQAVTDAPHGVIEIRKMNDRHVTNKRAPDFVVARATVQPPQKHEKLCQQRNGYDDPIWIHNCSLEAPDSDQFPCNVYIPNSVPVRPPTTLPNPEPRDDRKLFPPCEARERASNNPEGIPRARPSSDESVP
jgi:hypothetical protein